jgi:hypothetical protein
MRYCDIEQFKGVELRKIGLGILLPLLPYYARSDSELFLYGQWAMVIIKLERIMPIRYFLLALD